ncbi:diguanylate cyclase [Chitinimonas viridis]|uniref:diguanylate cyclase n=1 Tax=Chitinimonas viridis TaxID=664880 RepID=A0ABT8B4N4_9NEIS|nr:tetratricopeptide repeat-containing diguanylate cyclase [Chitinimonas viridis]MDN3577202.1 diguanylate cyclase [Chitinimonas viridis]
MPYQRSQHCLDYLLAGLLTLASLGVQGGVDWAAMEQRAADDPIKVREETLKLSRELQANGDKQEELAALRLLAITSAQMEHYTDLDIVLARGLMLARELNQAGSESTMLSLRGRLLAQSGKQAEAMRDLDAAISLAERNKRQRELASALQEKARLLQGESRFNEVLPLLFRAHALFDSLKLTADVSGVLNDIGNAYSTLGDEGQAVDYYRRSLVGLNPARDRHALSVRQYNIGVSLLRLERWQEAGDTLREALAHSEALNDATGVAYARFRLGAIDLKQGRTDAALQQLDLALQEFRRTHLQDMLFGTQLARAEALAGRDVRAAMAAMAEAEAIFKQNPTAPRKLMLHKTSSLVYKQQSRYREALAELEAWIQANKANDEQFNRKLTTEMQARFDSERKEADNALLKSERRRQAAELEAGKSRRLLLLLGLLCSVIAIATLAFVLLRQVRQKQRYAALAMHDELTGAPNRRHILAYGQRQLQACREEGLRFSLAVIDLDHFKSINDRYGHEVGDTVLRRFAQVCQPTLRRGDRLGRVGGEEWLLIMPATHSSEVPLVFERMRQHLQAQHEDLPAELIIAFSMGAAEAQPGESFERLMRRADAAMYRAKQQGRDQLVIARPGETS